MLENCRVIPVLNLKSEEETINVLSILHKYKIDIAEIVFRNEFALEAIKIAVSKFPTMEIGAGTVVSLSQAHCAYDAGVKFIVSPGFSFEIASFCREKMIAYFPGCVTPTEIMEAQKFGFDIIKFFPANVYGGLSALKSLSGPFPNVRFIPTGGITIENLEEYLSFDKVFAVGGTFLMKGDLEKNCEEITKITSKFNRVKTRMV